LQGIYFGDGVMIKQKKQKKRLPHKRNVILMFYLGYIKSYSDKIPYFRKIAKNLWAIGWKFSLKLKSFLQSVDLEKIYWINPKKIKYSFREDRYNFFSDSIYKDKEKVFIQDWDLTQNLMKFEERNSYKAYYQHFIEGKEWQETEFYKTMFKWGCFSEEEFIERCKELNKLYKDIKNNGFKTQKMLGGGRILKNKGIREVEDEIQVAVSRNGDLIYHRGQNRLSIAKILDLDKIPFKIILRHKEWMKFRKEIFFYIKTAMGGKAYQPLLHPDLSDIPSVWCNERFKIIKRNLTIKGGCLLDIGAHWGYFCHKFEEIGFNCIAIEDSQKNLYFLRKLKRAGNATFKIINKSIFDYEDVLNFDVVLVLASNIFYYFLKEEESYYKLRKLFNRLKTREMYIQTDGSEEIKTRGKHKNCSPEEFVDFVVKNSNLTKADCIGEVRGSKIYKLYY
jgi:hypothetical protein